MTSLSNHRSGLLAAVLLLPIAGAAAPFDAEILVDLRRLSDPQLSPDGREVAYVLRETDGSLRVVLHVHDELVAETVIGDEHDSRVLEHHMNTPPAWAAGLPLKAEVTRMQRFGK